MAATPVNHWYLREWIDTVGISQADLERLTEWDKRKASHLVSGKQPYKRDTLYEAAKALNVAPFELLLPPEEAFALRRMRESAVRIAADNKTPYTPAAPASAGKDDQRKAS